MVRVWIAVRIAALALLVVGCGQGVGDAPAGSTSSTSPPGATSGPTTEETTTTTSVPRDQRPTYDPPPQVPKKQAGLFFSQVPEPGGSVPGALGGGRLFVKNDCIYAGPTERRYRDEVPSDVVVWPYGYSLSRKEGEVLILDEKGRVVARVGEVARMGGGEITQEEAGPTPEAARRQFEEKRGELGVPDRCQGPLWVSSGVLTNPASTNPERR